eukprot:2501506-Alexandrium_andersonii.AAC.1
MVRAILAVTFAHSCCNIEAEREAERRQRGRQKGRQRGKQRGRQRGRERGCLLYTSDAADDM